MENPNNLVKVMFAVPNEGHTEPAAYDNRMEMCFHMGVLQALSRTGGTELDGVIFDYPAGTQFKFHNATIGKVFTALARERLAERAVDSGMDYLFMVDDDMIVPPDLFERLYRHNVDIVAPLAFTRYEPYKPVLYELKTGYDAAERKEFYINYAILNYPKNTLVQCDAVGFGAVLIKTSVLKAMKKPWFMTTSGAGEDIHFCHSAGKAGFKIFSDTSCKLGHLSDPQEITEELYESPKNVEGLKEAYHVR